MTRYITLKFLWMIPVLFLVSGAAFMMMHLVPGDPVDLMLLESGVVSPAEEARLRSQLGLDKPIIQQYTRWIKGVLTGNMGRSVLRPINISDELKRRFPVTLELVILSTLWASVLGVPIGYIIGRRPGSWMDGLFTAFTSVGIGMPSFMAAILLIWVLGVKLDLLPVAGYISPSENLWMHLKLMVMPSIAAGLTFFPFMIQQTRSSVLEIYGEQFIVTARSKGLAERRIFTRHALKLVMLPISTILGLRVGHMFGAAVIIEVVFSLPGTGRLLIEAVGARDFPVVQGVALLITVTVLVGNLVTDIFYAYLDPRIKYG